MNTLFWIHLQTVQGRIKKKNLTKNEWHGIAFRIEFFCIIDEFKRLFLILWILYRIKLLYFYENVK